MRLSIVLAGALLMAVLAFGWVSTCQSKKAALERLEQAEQAVQAGRVGDRISGEVATEKARARVLEEKQDAELDTAYEASPAWADQPVPSDVLDVLRE